MNLFLGFIFAFFLYQPGLDNSVSEQANSYLDNISNKVNLTENYWALNELFESTCSINSSVIRIIIDSDVHEAKSFFTKTPCGASESEKLTNKLSRLSDIAINYGLLDLYSYYALNESDNQKIENGFKLLTKNSEQSFSDTEIEIYNYLQSDLPIPSELISSIDSEFFF